MVLSFAVEARDSEVPNFVLPNHRNHLIVKV